MNTTPPPIPTNSSKTDTEIKVSFHMSRQLYDEIQSTLNEISSQLDMDLTMPKFVKRTVQDGWLVQAERYRKLDSKLRRNKSGTSEASRPNQSGSAAEPRSPNEG